MLVPPFNLQPFTKRHPRTLPKNIVYDCILCLPLFHSPFANQNGTHESWLLYWLLLCLSVLFYLEAPPFFWRLQNTHLIVALVLKEKKGPCECIICVDVYERSVNLIRHAQSQLEGWRDGEATSLDSTSFFVAFCLLIGRITARSGGIAGRRSAGLVRIRLSKYTVLQ